MAKRKINAAERSKPFTSIAIYIPMRISICGDVEMQKKWKKFFKGKNAPDKSTFILDNFKRDLKVKNTIDLFDDTDSKYWDQ